MRGDLTLTSAIPALAMKTDSAEWLSRTSRPSLTSRVTLSLPGPICCDCA